MVCIARVLYRARAAYAAVTLLRICMRRGQGLGGRVQEATSDVKRGREGKGAEAEGQWDPAARSALMMAECPLSSARCKADFPSLITKKKL